MGKMGPRPRYRHSDDALVRRAAGGDEEAFGELVRRHGDWLLARARKIAPDQAEDVTQAALMNAYRSIRSGTEPVELERWLARIVHNTAVSELRRARDSQPLHDLASERTTFDEVADRDRIRRAVDETKRLPELEREALKAQAFEGRGHEEIADARGASAGSVRMAVHRARRRLRAAVPVFAPLPLLGPARRAAARVRDVGPLGGAATAGALAAVAVVAVAAGGLPGGGGGEPAELAIAESTGPAAVGSRSIPARRNRDSAERRARNRDRAGKPDRSGGGSDAAGAAAAAVPAPPGTGAPPSSTSPPPSASPPSPGPPSPGPPGPPKPPAPPPTEPAPEPPPPPPPPDPPPSSGSSCPGLVSCLIEGIGGALTPGG